MTNLLVLALLVLAAPFIAAAYALVILDNLAQGVRPLYGLRR